LGGWVKAHGLGALPDTFWTAKRRQAIGGLPPTTQFWLTATKVVDSTTAQLLPCLARACQRNSRQHPPNQPTNRNGSGQPHCKINSGSIAQPQ